MSKDTKKENNKKNEQNNFIKDLKVELKKVTWPTGKELVSSTATVLFITLLLAVIVFVLDFGFEKANTYGVDKLKSIVSSSEKVEEENQTETTEESEETPEVTAEETNEATDANTTETAENTSTKGQAEQTESEESLAQ